jgi:hypothetical protein
MGQFYFDEVGQFSIGANRNEHSISFRTTL